MSKLINRFEDLHKTLRTSENISIIVSKAGFVNLDIQKYLQKVESKSNAVLSDNVGEAIAVTHENSMTYHCYLDV